MKNNMIVSRIQGGLGNQMFQWACGRKISISRECELAIDISSYRLDTKRKFRLSGFKNINNFLQHNISIFNGWLPSNLKQVDDNFNTFDFPSENLLLNGYWQSEKYFIDIADKIRVDFDLSDFSYMKDRYPDIESSVSMHIRRGDYVNSGDFHPVQPLEFYKNALEVLNKDYDKIYIFSDDIDWCKANILFDSCVFVENSNDFESIYLMSNAKHNITANSSFSWWGAWLNKNIEKKVICPKLWFGDISNLNSDNIVPNNWILY